VLLHLCQQRWAWVAVYQRVLLLLVPLSGRSTQHPPQLLAVRHQALGPLPLLPLLLLLLPWSLHLPVVSWVAWLLPLH
jgi:hypothetical protein